MDWSKRREFISRVDAEITEHGFIRREKMIEIYEHVYANDCNRLMNQCGGRNQAYHSLIAAKVKKLRGNIKDLVTIDDDGEQKNVRRWGYDNSIDAYVFQCKLAKDDEQIGHAVTANNYKRTLAKKFTDVITIEHKAIKEQASKVEKEQQAKRYWDSRPKLFIPQPDGTYDSYRGM